MINIQQLIQTQAATDNASDSTISIIWWCLLVVFIGLIILSFVVQSKFKKVTMEYSAKASTSGKTGAQISKMILEANGIKDVTIVKANNPKGFVDNYNPSSKVITLSSSVFDSTSIAAMSIAAHETGHAIQHAQATFFLRLRMVLAKPVMIISQVGSTIMQIGFMIFLFAILFGGNFNFFIWFIIPGLVLAGVSFIFSLVTLPVEYDASRRAKKNLLELNIISSKKTEEYEGVDKVLDQAAKTYLVAMLSSLTTLLLYILIILGRRN